MKKKSKEDEWEPWGPWQQCNEQLAQRVRQKKEKYLSPDLMGEWQAQLKKIQYIEMTNC